MRNLFYALKNIIFSYLIIYITTIIFTIFCLYINNTTLDNLAYVEKYIVMGMTLAIIPLTIYLYKKNYVKETKQTNKLLFLMIPLGISISLIYNMLTINFREEKTLIEMPLILLIIYSSILGPIFEEILFRYVSLKKAKEVYQEKMAIILITFVFAILHSNIITIAYAFILGLVLSIIYKRSKNIIYPILIHISANFTSIFIKGYNIYLLLAGLLLLIISIIYINKLNIKHT